MIRIGSDKSNRPGYVSEPLPGGGYIEYPAGIEPFISWRHIDGPLLYTSDCGLYWLTLWDRFLFWIGRTNIYALDAKYRRRP